MDRGNLSSYSKFVGATSDFAISPKAKSDVRADAMRLETRPHSWVGIVIRARDYLRDRDWGRAGIVGNIIVASLRAIRRIGKCHYLLNVSPPDGKEFVRFMAYGSPASH